MLIVLPDMLTNCRLPQNSVLLSTGKPKLTQYLNSQLLLQYVWFWFPLLDNYVKIPFSFLIPVYIHYRATWTRIMLMIQSLLFNTQPMLRKVHVYLCSICSSNTIINHLFQWYNNKAFTLIVSLQNLIILKENCASVFFTWGFEGAVCFLYYFL